MQTIHRIAAALLGVTLWSASASADGDVEAGKNVFKRCQTCHMVGPNAKNRIGPPLNGLFGRKAGTVEGFKYSPVMSALGEKGLEWNPTDFAGYLTDPKKWLPVKAKELGLSCDDLKNCRNNMAFAGLKKEKEIEDVVAYLMTFDADGKPKTN